ncbi:U3 snoRNP protein, partial [Nowakowskiella sp. JEL0078]
MAASWEYETNNNITTSRVLFLRGIRINPDSSKLWLEYFKLELLWITKILERRKIYFKENFLGDEINVQISDLILVNENDIEKEVVDIPHLKEESDIKHNLYLDDPSVAQSTTHDDSAIISKSKELSEIQKSILDLKIPRIIFRNAIAAIPTSLPLRIQFLQIYKSLRSTFTKEAENEIYESILSDFRLDPKARSFLATHSFFGKLESEKEISASEYFPQMVKTCVKEFEKCCQDDELMSTSGMSIIDEYINFLETWMKICEEEFMLQYFELLLKNLCQRSEQLSLLSTSGFKIWADLELKSNNNTAKTILNRGLKLYPNSSLLWLNFLEIFKQKQNEDIIQNEDEIENLFMEACKIIKDVDERWIVWDAFLKWTTERGSNYMKEAWPFERVLKLALRHDEMGSTPYEIGILERLLDYSYSQLGLQIFMQITNNLITKKERKPKFFENCIRIVSREVHVKNEIVRKFYDLMIRSNVKREESYLAALEFELSQNDMNRSQQLMTKGPGFAQSNHVGVYSDLKTIGKGTYGTVYKATHSKDGEHVALKKLLLWDIDYDGLPITVLREIKLLKELNCVNIVKVLDVVVEDIYM